MKKKKETASESQSPEQTATARTQRTIKKAKIVNGISLYVEYSEHTSLIDGLKRKDMGGTIKRDGENAVHEDLKAAFKRLDIHLALIAEMIVIGSKYILHHFDSNLELEQLKDFSVTGFSIGGSGDTEGVTLIGQKTLSTEEILNLTTPFKKIEGSDYMHMSELADAIERCKHEVIEYLNGKMAPPAQLEMELETAGTDEEEEQ